MAPCNLEFLDRCVSRELNDLHTVEQRFRDCIRRVRRADKQYIRQIIRNIHIMIREAEILLRVEHLEESRSRIAVVVPAQLVDLVQHDDRIRSTGCLHRIHNASGHCTDIGSAVAPDFRLVAYASKRNADILSSKCLCNALPDACLAGSRRSNEQKNRAGLFPVQAHDRKLLNHTVLDLLQSVVILVQNLLCLFQIDFLRSCFLPVK